MKSKPPIPYMPSGSTFITVEGNIGSGKSTFLKKFYETFKLPIILEPHTLWQNIDGHNLLEEFYQNTSRWAYSFQTHVFMTRIKALQEAVEQNPHENCFILERSVYADKFCFAKACSHLGLMSPLEWKMYCLWYDWFIMNYVKTPSGIIYLQVDPKISYQRTQKRKRSEESEISKEYITLLHEYHEQWLVEKTDVPLLLKNIPVLTLNCDEDFENTDANWDDLCVKIRTFIEQIRQNNFIPAKNKESLLHI